MNSYLTLWMCACVCVYSRELWVASNRHLMAFTGHTLSASVLLLSSFRLKWTACSSRVSISQNPQLFWCLRPSFHRAPNKSSVNSVNKPPHTTPLSPCPDKCSMFLWARTCVCWFHRLISALEYQNITAWLKFQCILRGRNLCNILFHTRP